MDTLRNPSGPLPASTYWRRRLVIMGVLLALVGVVVWACTRNSDAQQNPQGVAATNSASPTDQPTVPAETQSPTPTSSAPSGSGSGSASASPSASGSSASPSVSKKDGKTICPKSDLRVSVRSDQKFYSPGENPKFTVIVVNISKTSCYVDMGKAVTGLKIISGKDRVWSNNDCSSRPKEQLRKFTSGDVYTTTITWNRERSEEGCPDISAKAKPGYYVVDVTFGKAKPNDRPVVVLQDS